MKTIFLSIAIIILVVSAGYSQTATSDNTYETYFPVFKDGKMGYINISG